MQSQEWEQDTLESVSHEDWTVRKMVQEKRRPLTGKVVSSGQKDMHTL